jgi:ubiquitin-conjugating enzyme E2 D/E
MPPLSSAMTMKRIHREVADLKKEDLGPIVLEPVENNLYVWKGSIPGPPGSVYEGGVFNVEIILPSDYPFTAPKALFKTRIYHMNISEQGNICIDILKQNWSPALSLFKVMLSLSSLLTDPNPKDPLVPSIATLYTQNRKRHDATARQWTQDYAKPPPPVLVAIPDDPPKTSRSSKGKNRVDAQPVNNTGGSSSTSRSIPSTAAAPSPPIATTSSDVIMIDSDEDADNERSTGAKAKNPKRKRAPNGSSGPSGSEVFDLLDSDEERVMKKSRSRKAQNRADRNSGAGDSAPSTWSDDVIVIEDD